MPDDRRATAADDIPSAVPAPRRRFNISVVWLIPIVAALLGGWLVWKTLSETGPLITIRFNTAEGLEAGKTKVKYKDVVIGEVEEIKLAPAGKYVLVSARMQKYVESHLVDDCRFWVERPRIRGTSVEGLGTLLSGPYIAMDVGKAQGRRHDFIGLEKVPVITSDLPGRAFMLRAQELGSLTVGSPVYYRRVEVGQVYKYEMDQDGRGINIGIFVNEPYDRYVNSESRFWEASGFDLRMDASGVQLDTQSLNSILSGGIAFQTRGDAGAGQSVDAGAVFRLYKQKEQALSFEEQEVFPVALRFDQSLRGLSVGAPVDILGMPVGKVTDVYPVYDDRKKVVYMLAMVDLYPAQLSRIKRPWGVSGKSRRENVDSLVEGGLRAQLRMASLVTGQFYVSLEFFRNAPPAKVDWRHAPPLVPTMPSSLASAEDAVGEILERLRKLPLDKLGEDLRQAVRSLDDTLRTSRTLLARIETDVVPEAKGTMVDFRASLLKLDRTLHAAEHVLSPDSDLQRQLVDTLREVSRTSAAVRTLSETLELRPESVLRGKPDEVTP